MKLSAHSGATIAAAAAALILSGATFASVSQAADEKAKAEENVQCYGLNACKGQAACKTAKNDCKGLNECKGQGFVLKSKADCEKEGGKLEQS